MKPKISFLGPVYNKVAYVSETIENLKNQTLQDFEIVFVDDGSTDGTSDILKWYAKKDKRIRVIKLKKNVGLGKAWNIGTKEVNSDIVCVISGDDIWNPKRGEMSYSFFNKHKDKDVFYGSFYFCDAFLNPKEFKPAVPFNKKKLLTPRADGYCPQYIGHFVMSYTTKIALKVPYREEYRVGVDYPFLCDLANADAKFGWTKEVLGHARLLKSGVSIARRNEVEKVKI